MSTFSRRQLFLFALAAGMLNMIPRLMAKASGDVYLHYALINCMYDQFMQGDFYPRWCMNANAGLGSPVLFFYFPLPYYLSLLFYPLTYIGVTTAGIYLWCNMLVNIVTFLTGWRWLSGIIGDKRALLGTFLLLWMPYRMEVMLSRNAYAELWCIAFLPLVFHYVRCLVLGERRSWLPLGLSIAACFLSHLPCAFIGLIGCGIYVLWTAPRLWRVYSMFAAALILAAMLSAIYLLPAYYFLNFMDPESLEVNRFIWANSYISINSITEFGQGRVLLSSAIMVVMALLWGMMIFIRRSKIDNPYVRREAVAWGTIGIVAGLMSFKITGAPLWMLIDFIKIIATPWRLRLLIMFAGVFFFAVYISRLVSAEKMKTWKGDFIVLCAFLMLIGLVVIDTEPEGSGNAGEQAQKLNLIVPREYNTRWMESGLMKNFLFAQADRSPNMPKATLIRGTGALQITRWDSRNIEVTAELATSSLLRFEQFYFPCWHALIDGVPQSLSQEQSYARMLLEVPAGSHHITLYRSSNEVAPVLMLSAKYITMVSLFMVAALYFYRFKSPAKAL